MGAVSTMSRESEIDDVAEERRAKWLAAQLDEMERNNAQLIAGLRGTVDNLSTKMESGLASLSTKMETGLDKVATTIAGDQRWYRGTVVGILLVILAMVGGALYAKITGSPI